MYSILKGKYITHKEKYLIVKFLIRSEKYYAILYAPFCQVWSSINKAKVRSGLHNVKHFRARDILL